MHHRLFVAGLEIAKIGILLQGLPDAGDVAVAENTPASGEEGVFATITLDILVLEECDDRLGRGEAGSSHGGTPV